MPKKIKIPIKHVRSEVNLKLKAYHRKLCREINMYEYCNPKSTASIILNSFLKIYELMFLEKQYISKRIYRQYYMHYARFIMYKCYKSEDIVTEIQNIRKPKWQVGDKYKNSLIHLVDLLIDYIADMPGWGTYECEDPRIFTNTIHDEDPEAVVRSIRHIKDKCDYRKQRKVNMKLYKWEDIYFDNKHIPYEQALQILNNSNNKKGGE